MKSTTTQEPINSSQAVILTKNGHDEFFTLKFFSSDGWRYIFFGLFYDTPNERAKLAAARILYARLRRAGTVQPGTFCSLAGCSGGVYHHRKALREKGFSVH